MNIKEITLRVPEGRGDLERNRWTRPKARIYIWPEGETVHENLINRHQRPYTTYRKEVLPQIANLLGLDLKELDLRWSQKAGCSCPCSPGFIDTNGLLRRDLHVTITNEPVSKVKIDGDLLNANESLIWYVAN